MSERSTVIALTRRGNPTDRGIMIRRVLRATRMPHEVLTTLRCHPNYSRMLVAFCDHFTEIIPSRTENMPLASACIRNAIEAVMESNRRNDPDGVAYQRFVHGLVKASTDSLYMHVSVRTGSTTHLWDPSEEGLRSFWLRHGQRPVIRWRAEPWDTISLQDFRTMLAVKLFNRREFTQLQGGLRSILEMPI